MNGDGNAHYDIDSPVNIVAASQTGTVINANALDNVFEINSGLVNPLAAFNVFLTNVTLTGGQNANNLVSIPLSFNDLGGLIQWESDGAGTLTSNNVTLSNSKVLYGNGGAIGTSNSNGPADGTLELDNSTISGNSTAEAGGGLSLGIYNPLVLNLSVVSGNSALTSVNPSDPNRLGQGGGVATSGGSNTTQDQITNSTSAAICPRRIAADC